ncbi:MAG: outer membrane protein assembly factor BamA [Rhodocyclaceae bacterium]|nr:outer membrane protein assembly factor BamA [Rhodocyclaceae bacterium]
MRFGFAALAFAFSIVFSDLAVARDPVTIRDIRVEGIQRVEAGTVFSYLPLRVGDVLDDDRSDQAIKALFETGFFKDVRLELEGDVLVVIVEERPSIASVDIEGTKEFPADALKSSLQELGLGVARTFDRALLDKAEQELKRQYNARGKYAATVTTTVTPLERNRVGLRFSVVEGEAAKIRQIRILGARTFKEADLLDELTLRTPDWLSWYTKNDQYSKQKLQADLETLRSYYLNRGYLEFNVEGTQVSLTPDRKSLYITISISEGEPYKVTDVKLAGEFLVPEEELRKLIKVSSGDSYSREKLNASTKAISDRLSNDGYAFANVNAAPEIDKEKRTAAFTLFIDPGRRVYVRRIVVNGNTKTRDEVVRREFRQMEGGWYSAAQIDASKRRIDRTGYFAEVGIETPAVPGSSDQIDVNVKVKEKSTGAITLGGGFSSDGLLLSSSVSQANVLGSGNSISLAANTGRINTVYSLSFTNPYSTVDGVSRGFDLYKRRSDLSLLSFGPLYNTDSLGGGVRFGVPINETDTINLGLAFESTTLEVFGCEPDSTSTKKSFRSACEYVARQGESNNGLIGSLGWARNRLNSFILPTSGHRQRATLEFGTPGLDLKYYKVTYDHLYYTPLVGDFVLKLNGEVGYANGYSGSELPFFKNFYAGGIGSVRGFRTSTLGPKDTASGAGLLARPVGGNQRVVATAEVLYPIPGLGKERNARISTFVDGGLIRNSQENGGEDGPKFSAGIGVYFVSPFGPIQLSVAKPLNSSPNDITQIFQFTMGSQF